jgi:hypothetical protein
MLARLNPTNVRFDVGRGGGNPELTNIDIAGALGMVPAGLGREVLEACWWPDGAALRGHKLQAAVIALVVGELQSQRLKLLDAERNEQIVESQIFWANQYLRRGATATQLDELKGVVEKTSVVRDACWPANTIQKLPLIVQAIVEELRGDACSCCGGTRFVEEKGCTECSGTGREKCSDRRRAIRMKTDPSDFARRWRVVYQWLFTRFADAEAEAARCFGAAIRRVA